MTKMSFNPNCAWGVQIKGRHIFDDVIIFAVAVRENSKKYLFH